MQLCFDGQAKRLNAMKHAKPFETNDIRQTLPMKDSVEIEVETCNIPEIRRNRRCLRPWHNLMSKFKAAPRIWPSMKQHNPARDDDSLLMKKFSIPSDQSTESNLSSADSNDATKRFTFSQGIPIKGSDENNFTNSLIHRMVVNPEGRILFMWLFCVSAAWLYSVWALIARQAFRELRDPSSMIFWFVLDYSSDFIYLVDILVQLRTGFLENGLLVCKTSKLTRHYLLSRRFVMDVACLLPTDFLYFLTGSMEPLYRFPRFLKGYRAKQFYRKAESATSYPNVLRVIFLGHTMMLLMHWFACFYFMISESEDFYTPEGEVRGWAYPLPKGDNTSEWSTLRRKYLHSIYWSCLTLTTIGEKQSPSTDLEYICTLAAYFLGIFVFATVVGQVGNVIANKNANRLEFERMVDNAKTFMKTKNVPKDMQTRVLRWYDYSWSRGTLRGSTDVNRLGMMPDTLKVELAIQVNLNTLRKVSIFRLVQPEFLYHLVLKMKSCIYTPGDLICRQGEVAREMFIISHGILEVVSESGTIMARLKAGDFFGEIGILNIMKGVNKRVANVRSVGYSEVFTLEGEDVLQAMEYYPEAKRLLLLYGRQRLEESSQHPGSDAHELLVEKEQRSMKMRESIASIASRRKERAKSASAPKRRSIRLRSTKSFSGRTPHRGGTEMLAASVASSLNVPTVFNASNNEESFDQASQISVGENDTAIAKPKPTEPETKTTLKLPENREESQVMERMRELVGQMQQCLGVDPKSNGKRDSIGEVRRKVSYEGDAMQLIEMQKQILNEERKKVNSLQEDIKLLMEKLENTMKQESPRTKRSSKNLVSNNNNNGGVGDRVRMSFLFGEESDGSSDREFSKIRPVHSTSFPKLSKHASCLSTSASQEFTQTAPKSTSGRRKNRWPILNAALRLRKFQRRPTLVQGATPSRRVDLRSCGRLLEGQDENGFEIVDLVGDVMKESSR